MNNEPVAWMVYTLDGKSVCVTDNPHDFTNQHRALPLYTQDDTALLRQAVEAMQTLLDAVQDKTVQMRTGVVIGGSAIEQATEVIAALRERLK